MSGFRGCGDLLDVFLFVLFCDFNVPAIGHEVDCGYLAESIVLCTHIEIEYIGDIVFPASSSTNTTG